MEKEEVGKTGLLVAVGVSGSRKSKYLLRWAMDKFLPEGNVRFRIIHVYPKITQVPTPMGTWIPIAEFREEVANGYREEVQWKKKKTLLPIQQNLKAQKVPSDIVALESDDVATTLCLEVKRHSIRHLVIGPSSTSIFSMKILSLAGMMSDHHLSEGILENAPSFCSVYVVADGKLQNLRPSESEPTVISILNTSDTSALLTDDSSSSSTLTRGRLLKSKPSSPKCREPVDTTSDYSESSRNDSAASQSSSNGDSKSWVSDRASHGTSLVRAPPSASFTSTPVGRSFVGTPSSVSYVGTLPAVSFTETYPVESIDGTSPVSCVGIPTTGFSQAGAFVGTPSQQSSSSSEESFPQGQNKMYNHEKSRIELRHPDKTHQLAHDNNIDEKVPFPLNQQKTLSKERLEAGLNQEEKANETTSTQKNKHKAVPNKAEPRAQRNKHCHKKKTDSAKAEDNENKLKQCLSSPVTRGHKFSWNEIVDATSSLSEDLKIGAGAFGTVYKCKLHHTTVAVKVLHSKDTVIKKQFLQELEILSTIRHPHILLLLGAVPEQSCLVYEYMENGSLEDRLFRKDNCSPLPWYERVRICWEVAGALAFLHSTKPRPIIHRDLKPANILLDQHLVSKIGDAGLGTTITMDSGDNSLKTLYKDTSPVGTLCYIDPEYQRTGRVSTKSDIYALGIVILQLLTTKSAVGIVYLVEDALEEATLMEELDQEAGKWPEEVALELASLGLLCSELRGRDRLDLREIVLPTLERLKKVADSAQKQAANASTALPAHVICPISKDIMDDPYVAADGYTYNRAALEKWLEENNTSPTTNIPLPHKFIMPNNTILEAIMEWKSKQPTK